MNKLSIFIILLASIFLMVGCGVSEDDDFEADSDGSTSNTDSDYDTDTGKNDPVVEEKEECDKKKTFKCKTDQTDGSEYSYYCNGNNPYYLYKFEECRAGCNTSTGKCNPWKDPDTGFTWSSFGIDESPNSSDSFHWYEASKYCISLEENGLTGWRLPNIDELRTLIQNCPNTEPGGACKVSEKNGCLSMSECYHLPDCKCSEDQSGKYSKLGYSYDDLIWSSSNFIQKSYAYPEGQKMAWFVFFPKAKIEEKSTEYGNAYVRCVLRNAD